MLILLFSHEFLRNSVGLVRLDRDFYTCGNKLREKTSENLLLILKNNPSLTFDDLARTLNITDRSVEYQIGKLVRQNRLRRAGARKKGRWIVL